MARVEVRSAGKGCWRVFVDEVEIRHLKSIELDWPMFNGFPEVTIRLTPDEFRVAHDENWPGTRLDDKPGMGFKAGV